PGHGGDADLGDLTDSSPHRLEDGYTTSRDLTGQFIMRNEGWREWTDKWGSRVTSRKTFYQQYSCHVLGGFSNWAGDWNLEASRRDNAWWAANVAFHRCNW
ncbi:hypothetical protein ACLMMA_07615, partial [Micrococcus luteus]